MADPVRTPLDQGFVARIAAGIRYAIKGVAPSDWFGPQQPLAPVAPAEVKDRAYDYPVGYNVNIRPRAYEPISFADLRALADGYDLLRLVIETRKDQIERLQWIVKPRDKKAKADARCDAIMTRLRRPDRLHTWHQWLRMVLEDMLVIDAPTVYLRRTNGGEVFSLDVIDGATIAPKIDQTGRAPVSGPAYQQVLKGVPAVDYGLDELIYFPRNVRSFKVYGCSPVEQIVMTVNIALRRQVHQLQFYTEGSTPDLILSVPPEWSVDQIRQFEGYWQSILSGNTAERRHTRFVPAGLKVVDTKEGALKDAFDDWLARIVCFAFSISPQALVQQQNRATAQVADESAAKEGLAPLMQWVKAFADEVIGRGYGADDLEFVWVEEEAQDPLKQAEVAERKVRSGALTIDEWRASDGLEPLAGGLGAVPLVFTVGGAVRLEDVINPPEPEAAEPQEDDGGPEPEGEDGEVGKAADGPF